jgi:hypothetical protein
MGKEKGILTMQKTSYTTSNGLTVSVGDLVLNWADEVGVVVSIKRDFSRWRVYVHMLKERGNYTPAYYASRFGSNSSIRPVNHTGSTTTKEG